MWVARALTRSKSRAQAPQAVLDHGAVGSCDQSTASGMTCSGCCRLWAHLGVAEAKSCKVLIRQRQGRGRRVSAARWFLINEEPDSAVRASGRVSGHGWRWGRGGRGSWRTQNSLCQGRGGASQRDVMVWWMEQFPWSGGWASVDSNQ